VDHGPRYAVFFVPPARSALYRFGSAILGYDCYDGVAVDPPEEFKADLASWRKLTEHPRRFGFHATLKAPFRLSASCTEAQLVSAVQSFVGLGHAVAEISPVIQIIDGFAAVIASNAVPALATLAAGCTTMFDAFRAPMLPQERARLLAAGLNASESENLDRWGYPFVLSEFEFQMTLTGPIQGRRRAQTLDLIERCFRRMVRTDHQIAIDRIALLKQATSRGSFRVISHAALRAGH
jgi:hypothetical protein